MAEKNITCISCPVGCSLSVELRDGEAVGVRGNECPRGEIYGKKESTDPTRIFTSSVPVDEGYPEMLSVKSARDIPRDMFFDCVRAIGGIRASAPVSIGDVVVKNLAGTGVDLVATRNVVRI